MKLSLKTKVTAFIAVVVIAVTAVSTGFSVDAHKRSVEREITARGAALAEALARSVDEGLASENLNLIKDVEEVVHTNDVVLTQVFSSLWLGIASVPANQLNVEPSPEAIAFFRKPGLNEHAYYARNEGAWIDVYHPVFFDPHDSRLPKIVIGFVRLKISTGAADRAVGEAIAINVIAGIFLALLSVVVLNALMGKYLLKPILHLHDSIVKHRQGEFANAVPVETDDEIGELSMEFNEMSRALREREERLAQEKERLGVTLRSIGDAVIVTDINGAITMMNRVAERFTGWTAREAGGKELSQVFRIVNERTGEPCEHPVKKVLTTGLSCGLANHTVLIKKDGSRIAIEDSAAPIRDRESRIIGVVLVFRDVTEKRRIEEEMIKAEKLQSVGLLAGGLAHDFNNLLTSIVGNISIAKMYLDAGSKAHARLTEAETASRRATDLTYQLLTFSKGGAPVRKTASITDIIRESASFALSGTAVAPEFAIGQGIWNVDVDAGQMSQVFNNLIINAVHAMPTGGVIRFSAANFVLGENEMPTLPPGTYLKIRVGDTGTGISPDHLSRVFEPYFTTKQKGSGLGLASVYSIVKRHDGHVTVDSIQGQGTTFTIYLPASPGKTSSAAGDQPAIADGHGRVLVMDDEKIIQEVAGEMLRELGYETDFAQNGAEAVELYRKSLELKHTYTAVIMDLTVPAGMGGKEAMGKLRELDPGVRAIVSSGYSNDPIMADYERYGFKGVIVKPYSIAGLSKALSEVVKE